MNTRKQDEIQIKLEIHNLLNFLISYELINDLDDTERDKIVNKIWNTLKDEVNY